MTRPDFTRRTPSFLIAGLLAFAGGLVCASAALAQTAAPAGTSAPAAQTETQAPDGAAAAAQKPVAKAKRRGDRMVCKQETILGTRLKTSRTCRTADEWRRISRGFQEQYKNATDKGGAIYSGS